MIIMKWPFLFLFICLPLANLPLAAAEDAEATKEQSFTLEFPGGILAELLELAQQASPEPINIIDPGQAGDIAVPPLKLHAVNPSHWWAIVNHLGKVNVNGRYALERVTENTWALVTPEPPAQQAKGEAAFFPVGRLLEEHTVDDLITAVSTAWEMLELPESPTSHLRFHEDTKLLIVTGDASTVALVESALKALDSENRGERERQLMNELEKTKRFAEQLEERNVHAHEMIKNSHRMAAEKMELDLQRLAEENANLRARIRELESGR